MIAEFLAAVGATEPAADTSRHTGWPLLAVAGVIGLCAYTWIYRRREDDQ